MNNFDLRKFLVENKLTNQTRKLNEVQAIVDVDNYMAKDGGMNLDVFYRADDQTFGQALSHMTPELFSQAIEKEIDRFEKDPGTPEGTNFYLWRVGAIISTNESEQFLGVLEKIASALAKGNPGTLTSGYIKDQNEVYVEFKPPYLYAEL